MIRLIAALVATGVFASAIFADRPTLLALIETADPAALAAFAADPAAPGAEARLAQAFADAAWNRDADAAAGLTAALEDASLAAGLRRRAATTLAGVRLRETDFAGAVAAFDQAAELGGAELEAGELQARVFAQALRDVPATGRGPLVEGEVEVRRDLADLARANVAINGHIQDAVLDTGAGFSTMTAGAAERLGLRMLDADVTVGAAANAAVASRLGVAGTLEIGGMVFTDVVFIVLADEALSFAGGVYTIDAIVGFPVLSRLGRVSFERDEDGEALRFGPSSASGATPNLMLEGLQPVALVGAEGADGTLRLLIDTGARVTLLGPRFGEDHPELIAGAETREATFAGAGGQSTHADALSLESLTLIVAGAPVTITDVSVAPSAGRNQRHGILGQDVLRSGRGFVIDFEAMRFELLPDE